MRKTTPIAASSSTTNSTNGYKSRCRGSHQIQCCPSPSRPEPAGEMTKMTDRAVVYVRFSRTSHWRLVRGSIPYAGPPGCRRRNVIQALTGHVRQASPSGCTYLRTNVPFRLTYSLWFYDGLVRRYLPQQVIGHSVAGITRGRQMEPGTVTELPIQLRRKPEEAQSPCRPRGRTRSKKEGK